MRKVPAARVVTTLQASESPLPAAIQKALGELVGAAREGPLALSVGVGLGVVHELLKTPPGSNPMDLGRRSGARVPEDFVGTRPPAVSTSRRRGCVASGCVIVTTWPQGESRAPVPSIDRQ